jgi:HAMP domain-containing protein
MEPEKVTAFIAQAYPDRAPKAAVDDVDEEAMRTGRPVARFVAGAYRYSMPIVLGQTLAAPKEICESCHGLGMGLQDGEVIAVFSSSVSTAADFAALQALLIKIAGGGALGGVLVVFGIWRLLGGVVTHPLQVMTKAMRRLAEGDATIEVPAQARADEIGQMARAVLVFRDAAAENARLEYEARENRANCERDRQQAEAAQNEAIRHERAVVVSSIGVALARLADMDLAYRITADIPAAYGEQDRLQCGDGPARAGDARGHGGHRRHSRGRPGHRQGGRRLVDAHRAAGFQPRTDDGCGRADRQHSQDRRRRRGACANRRRRR